MIRKTGKIWDNHRLSNKCVKKNCQLAVIDKKNYKGILYVYEYYCYWYSYTLRVLLKSIKLKYQ